MPSSIDHSAPTPVQVLCQVAEGGGEGVEEAVSAIAQEKKLDLAANVELAQRLRAGLVRVLSVRVLYNEVEGLRAHPYSQENEEHEKMLMEVRFLCPAPGNETPLLQ